MGCPNAPPPPSQATRSVSTVMISKGSVTISLLLRRRMIAAATARGHAFRLLPRRSFRRAARCAAPTLTADRYVAADGTALPVAVWPAANGAPDGRDPGAARLRRLPQRLGGAGRDLGRRPASRPMPTTSAASARARRAAAGPAPTTLVEDAEGDGHAAARPSSRRADLRGGRKHGRRDRPRRRRPGSRGRRADPARHGAALARHAGTARERRALVLRPHHPVVAARPDLDRLQADRQSQDAREAAGTIR